jgi:hypothetical protein
VSGERVTLSVDDFAREVSASAFASRSHGLDARVKYPRFKYSCLSKTRPVLHSVAVDVDTYVEVVGDGANGCYEWVIRQGDAIRRHSDCGYGQCTVAFRDGLIAWHGMPDDSAREVES